MDHLKTMLTVSVNGDPQRMGNVVLLVMAISSATCTEVTLHKQETSTTPFMVQVEYAAFKILCLSLKQKPSKNKVKSGFSSETSLMLGLGLVHNSVTSRQSLSTSHCVNHSLGEAIE